MYVSMYLKISGENKPQIALALQPRNAAEASDDHDDDGL